MSFSQRHCPECKAENFKGHPGYTLKNGEARAIYYWRDCASYFSETKHRPLAGLKTPLSRMVLMLEAINDGMGLNAACRTFHVGNNSLKRWLSRLGDLQETLLLDALCQQFIQQMVEADELYPKVGQNKPALASEGWTVVLMDRASRFIWELSWGQRETDLFQQALETLAQVIAQTDDLTLVTDGERR